MGKDGGGDAFVTSPAHNKIKFLCSYGGKILPRGVDGGLKYVGGETRVVAICRDIKLKGLMQKVITTAGVSEGDVVLKYQLIPEDLDSLVSVKNDEDVKHMVDEYDRHGHEGTPKLRAFLFPSHPVVIDNHMVAMDPQAIEQRYIDAINGIVRASGGSGGGRLTPINASRPSFSISSACSSPKSASPDSFSVESNHHEFVMADNSYHNSRLSAMHKVRSSPSLCSLNTHHHQGPSSPKSSYIMHNQQQHLGQHHHYHQQQQHLPPTYQAYRWSPPQPPVLQLPPPVGGHGPNVYTRSHSSRSHLASGSHTKYGCYEELPYGGLRRNERADSLPHHTIRSGHNLEIIN